MGMRELGGGILGCPIVLGNSFFSSLSAGRQVSIVQLGGSGSSLVLLARVVLRALGGRLSRFFPCKYRVFLSVKRKMKQRLRVSFRVLGHNLAYVTSYQARKMVGNN